MDFEGLFVFGPCMESKHLLPVIRNLYLSLLALSIACLASSPYIGEIRPGFQASQKQWVDHRGRFLVSNNSAFALGFYTGVDVTTFVLNIVHVSSSKAVWTANRNKLVGDSDKFVFGSDGNLYLKSGNDVVWSTDTAGKLATALVLQDSGNLVLLGDNKNVLWQSFGHPTDTLLPGQEFVRGMKLQSFPKNGLLVYLEIKSGDLVLYAGYQIPQTYWSASSDGRFDNTTGINGAVHSVSLVSDSLSIYDESKALIGQLNFSEKSDPNALWAVVLGSDGTIKFSDLQEGKYATTESVVIPQNACSIPEPCDPYKICYFSSWCQCPPTLVSYPNCRPPTESQCPESHTSSDLVYVGENLDYFALGFVAPSLKSDLHACKEACQNNCSCNVLFFNKSSGNCFMFDQIGSFSRSDQGTIGYESYAKVSSKKGSKKHTILIVLIVVATFGVLVGLIYGGLWYHRRKNKLLDYTRETQEEDYFFNSLSGMPVRFSYNDLRRATKNFSTKVGQGGFGSVYQGVLPDGTQLAVKKLEGIGQGKKEFRAEVSIIGSIHHVHLVRLKGFCSEGTHRLLVYEFMGKSSLDKWIFQKNQDEPQLDWDTRYNIALATAKGLAYLHEECEFKIVHCDIKPENVLLDDNYTAKVSDFGLAKLMSREESLVYTTLRGTRGYLAPEWITNNPISEKSDVFSYGVVLLEIIGGRKNYDPSEISEKAHFPSYAFKMLEEGKMKEIVDPRLEIEENDVRVAVAIKVALWCIQDEMHLRPPMTKVVQMLEGLCMVPDPLTLSHLGSQSNLSFLKWSSEDGSSSGLMDWNSEALLSGVQLSGPR